MGKPISRECTNCGNARWQFTATGQIRKRVAGRCSAEPTTIAPACVKVEFRRNAIWPGDGKSCQTWTERKDEPC